MAPKNDIKEVFESTDTYELDSLENSYDPLEEEVMGQLAVDLYQTDKDLVLKAPIAGVKSTDLDITVTDEMISVKGSRKEEKEVHESRYTAKECYWGSFARTINLPVLVVPDKAKATFKNGILTIRVPKASQSKLRKLKVTEE
ncbi:MAG: Hsp20/alpha crystallin family protein [Patescibacteria group bacterium]|nr:Hsp20/alpha crystallin family protein [Patescibacteria group bacterium]MCL5093715.1 Hsp20/alpha crystallin family protein [Patescibacteria group bacterium]